MFNFTISDDSESPSAIHCDVLNGMALVSFKSGDVYAYFGVSRKAMLNLKFNKTISLVVWFYTNLCDHHAFTHVANLSDLSFTQIQKFCSVYLKRLSTTFFHIHKDKTDLDND